MCTERNNVRTVAPYRAWKDTVNVRAGETVRISGLGTFETADTAARTARNPSTGEAVDVPASKRVSFKASKPLKDAVKATVTTA